MVLDLVASKVPSERLDGRLTGHNLSTWNIKVGDGEDNQPVVVVQDGAGNQPVVFVVQVCGTSCWKVLPKIIDWPERCLTKSCKS